ncbi:MAG TPA: PAS domain S-box protein [Planctomycetota bacterium]|nr:PAS domain S-box protein [Planctomycetota bacterium]
MSEPAGAANPKNAARTHLSAWTWRVLMFAALLPILLLGLYSYRVASDSVRKLVRENNEAAAKITAVLLKRELDRSISFAETLATLPGTKDIVERRDEEAMRSRLKAVVESNAGIDRATMTAVDGVMWSDYPRAPETLGRNMSDRDWFVGVSQNYEPFVSSVYPRLADLKPLVVAVAAPVERSGIPIGIISIHYRLEGLSQWLGQVHVGEGGHVVVLDPNGVVAVHPRLDLQAQMYREYASLEPVQSALLGENVNTEYTDPFEKKEMVASLTPVTVAGRRWVVSAQQPASEAYAPINSLRLEIALAAAIVAVLGLGAVSALTRINSHVDRLNAELRERNHKLGQLALIVQSSNDAILSTSLDGTILSWNPGCERLYGYSASEAIGQSAGMLIPKRMPDELAENLAQIRKGERIENREAIRVAKDGRELIVELSVAPLRSEDGRIEGATTIGRNVSEQRRAEQALRESIERFQLVARGTNDGLWDWNVETNRVYFSSRWKEMLGYRDDEIENNFSEWESRLHSEDHERALATIKEYFDGKTPVYELEHRLRHKDGTYRWILARGFALRHANGKPYRMTGSHIDLTERKKAADELAAKAKELARSNAELEQFAYVASHDLREPLRAINSHGQLLARRAKERLDVDAEQHLKLVLDGAERMKNLINDLLEYSRLGTRVQTLTAVDCNAILAHTLENLKVALEESGGVVESEPLPTLRADGVQLTQVFQNLIGNALKFKGAQPPRVRISALRREHDWLFAVKDNGIGIDPQHFKRIFAVFARLHTREEYPGTGIGLSICKRIVERHGGTIWVESEVGKGAAFYFSIAC